MVALEAIIAGGEVGGVVVAIAVAAAVLSTDAVADLGEVSVGLEQTTWNASAEVVHARVAISLGDGVEDVGASETTDLMAIIRISAIV